MGRDAARAGQDMNLITNPLGPLQDPRKFTQERWYLILRILNQIDNVDERLFALRKFCDTLGLCYTALFAVIATDAAGVLWCE